MLPAVEAAGFQIQERRGVRARRRVWRLRFRRQFTPGAASTFQVERATFDKLLADEAEKQGVEIRYEVRVTAVTSRTTGHRACVLATRRGSEYDSSRRTSSSTPAASVARCRSCLELETPSEFPGA